MDVKKGIYCFLSFGFAVNMYMYVTMCTLSASIFVQSYGFRGKTPAVVNGQVKRLQDDDVQSNVLELVGSNVQSTFITCPADPTATLGIKLPFLVMIVKNMKKYFTFEIQVLDDKNVRRRFRASNYQVCKFYYKVILVVLTSYMANPYRIPCFHVYSYCCQSECNMFCLVKANMS